MNEPLSVTVVDLGTYSCSASTLYLDEYEEISVLGLVHVQSEGLAEGEIYNTEKAAATVRKALDLLSQKTQSEIYEVSLLFNGISTSSQNSQGVTAVQGYSHSREVSEEDVEKAMFLARQIDLSSDYEYLHEIPRAYKIDGKIIRDNPISSIGVRLDVDVHIITCLKVPIDNLIEAVVRSGGRQAAEIVHSTVGASYIGQTLEELNRGSLLIDLGYGSTSFQYSYGGHPVITENLPIGNQHLDNDLAQIFQVSQQIASQIKMEHGVCWPPLIPENLSIIIPGSSTTMAQESSQAEICEILQARAEEILEMIYERLEQTGMQPLHLYNVVLIGGGALLPGISELAESIFERPVRLGMVLDMRGLKTAWKDPRFTGLFGLAMYSLEEKRISFPFNKKRKVTIKNKPIPFILKLIGWFKRYFA